MAPNGMMVVWTGLLLRAQNEAQLAAVIGHESGHYIKRHSLKSWLDAKARTDLMVLLSIGIGVGGVPAGGNIFNITQLLQAGFMAKHSRDNEREADYIGKDKLISAPTSFFLTSPKMNPFSVEKTTPNFSRPFK